MPYHQLLTELTNQADDTYKAFHKRLLKNDDINVLGVRVPALRKIAKNYKNNVDELLTYPDDYYEVTFVKLTAVACLKFEDFIKYVDKCVPLINNWATCDCFVPKCIEKHKQDFLPYIVKYSGYDGEFYQRFALTTLLHFYVEEKYLSYIENIIRNVNTGYYYVHMAAAWLIAEMLVKFYDKTLPLLELSYKESLSGENKKNILDKKTHNKAIQKACESYRLSDEKKNYLKGIKR